MLSVCVRSIRVEVCLCVLAFLASWASPALYGQTLQPAPAINLLPASTTQPPLAAASAGHAPLLFTPLIVGLPTAQASTFDQLVIQPQVQQGSPVESTNSENDLRFFQMQRPSAVLTSAEPLFQLQELLPAPQLLPDTSADNGPPEHLEAAPVFESILYSAPLQASLRSRRKFFSFDCPGQGLGQERLPYSLFEIDPAQPFNNFRMRTVLASRMHLPDRAEYFWQRTQGVKGPPLGESVIDYQEQRLRLELGSKKFSTTFEVPFRATNPELNRNHAGLGDLRLITKTVFIQGDQWLLTQYFGTQFPTGSSTMGLGTGHFALEPGLLFRNRLRDRTWMHGELKFWFPLGSDPQYGGQVLKYAVGFNRVWWETDTTALIPSFEFNAYSVLNGMARPAAPGNLINIDGDSMLYLTPGLRYAADKKGDFGLFEIGGALSIATTHDRFTDSTFLFDLRWSW